MMIDTLLIANRGEIALRVIRTARRMGIRTVAIHTALDADAPHVRAADATAEVPSYLDVDAVVEAAGAPARRRSTRATASSPSAPSSPVPSRRPGSRWSVRRPT